MTETCESPIVFPGAGARLLGILHHPPAQILPHCGMVLVVGGPQYRVGSHRLFVTLARRLAADGVAVLRFDCRGQGDSTGPHPGFANIEADIRAAVDCLTRELPALRTLALWGLCDAASAISFYAAKDPRVAGISLVNPWVREGEDFDETLLRHYYGKRILSREFWQRFFAGRVEGGDFVRRLARWIAGKLTLRRIAKTEPLSERLAFGLSQFSGDLLLILSGQDLTAREFEDKVKGLASWQAIIARSNVERRDLADADHTFSRPDWTQQLCDWTATWLRKL